MNQASETTEDTLLGGRVRLRQPAKGYRVAIDPVFLAAAISARPGDRIVELGAGVGAASLCLAKRVPDATVVGIELVESVVELARANVRDNALHEHVEMRCADLRDPLSDRSFTHAMANPPFLEATRARRSPNALKDVAHVEGEADLRAWVDAAFRAVESGGTVTFVHRPDRLSELTGLFSARGGSVVVFPLWAKAGGDATRILVRGVKGSRAPARLAAGLVLHDAGGGYSVAAEAVLRHGQGLQL